MKAIICASVVSGSNVRKADIVDRDPRLAKCTPGVNAGQRLIPRWIARVIKPANPHICTYRICTASVRFLYATFVPPKTPLDPCARPVYTPLVGPKTDSLCNAVFGRSRRWGPIPAKGEAT